MAEEKNTPITKEYLLEKVQTFATPIDFELLISERILEKKGAGYKVLDMTRLPQYAKDKIIEFCADGSVKFAKVTKSVENLAKKLSE